MSGFVDVVRATVNLQAHLKNLEPFAATHEIYIENVGLIVVAY